ncbi:MAG: 5,6-dimethylbenzimidazole synthase [Rhodobacter sp.]|uniref:5,6-dimethylbenzimidazole synthase n=1 Tax=Pararhodobacter sp. TaxID=2127056 RepID=UPI001DD624D4|nr:5,6-dimethylbenzimidazole synthase [Pararhodobacter sp.]MCB1347035.1 5,6-dimethylbenzimidazole synthase [Paracoccaceae bacterium]MCC0072970.1 5,6-dimethylbenzimidazole synthase [Rhodobacter sp.]HPD93364.1 5,6-dimethylbenzimidazole synthase [Pararhodobacter sp.]
MKGAAVIGEGAFSADFRAELAELLRWRRDVRHFRRDPVDEAVLARCLDAFRLAPSVGLSEPWRLIRVHSEGARAAVQANFETANAAALTGYDGARAELYAGLKLSGMREAPVHLAVFCDDSAPKGQGLGARTMPEMRRYSVAGAVMQLWLLLRAEGLGMGWVSILDPDRLARDLGIDDGWRLVAYLCIGWPEAQENTPELERMGWERRATHVRVETR